MDDLRRRVYQAFDPSPLRTKDEIDRLYVELDSVRGATGLVEELGLRIDSAKPYTVQLLTGHKGSGKSTELARLRAFLELRGWFVVCTDITQERRELDLSDVDFPELLITMLRDLVEHAESVGVTLRPGYTEDLLGRLKSFLSSEWEATELKLKTGLVELAGAVRNREARTKIREIFVPDMSSWLHAANELIDRTRQGLTTPHNRGVVFLVDGLDQLVDDKRDRSGWREHLYKDRRNELSGLRCHVVYTVPLDLILASRGTVLADVYGMTQIPVVPMVKVREKPPSNDQNAAGVAHLRQVVGRRLTDLQVLNQDVFVDGVVDYLIDLSAGQLRQLMLMIRDASTKALPITRDALEQVARGYRLNYSYWLGPPHWELLRQIQRTGSPHGARPDSETLAELIETRAILHYRNAGQWYGVNPLIEVPAEAP
ncbi:MAG: hypothetical protein U1D55_08320 [Phycisphaerae bacterium]